MSLMDAFSTCCPFDIKANVCISVTLDLSLLIQLLKLSSKADDNSLSSQSDLDPEQLYLLVKGVALELVESADHYHICQQPGDLWAENKQPNQQVGSSCWL